MAARSDLDSQDKIQFNDGSLDIIAGEGKGTLTLDDVTVKGSFTSADVTNEGQSIHDKVAGKEVSGNGDITGVESGEVDETSTLDEDIAEVTPASGGITGNDSSAADNITGVCKETSGC